MDPVLIVLALCALLLAGAMLAAQWADRCNERTLRDRQKLLYAAPLDRGDYAAYMRAYRSVSYERHLAARVQRRDPRRLYPPPIGPARPPNPMKESLQ